LNKLLNRTKYNNDKMIWLMTCFVTKQDQKPYQSMLTILTLTLGGKEPWAALRVNGCGSLVNPQSKFAVSYRPQYFCGLGLMI
jgi:hypothetical protein